MKLLLTIYLLAFLLIAFGVAFEVMKFIAVLKYVFG